MTTAIEGGERRVVALMDAMVDRMKVIQDLELPSGPPGLTMSSKITWLKEHYTQMQLRAFMHAGYKTLDTFSHEDPEWDVLADILDAFWYALDADNRP